MKENKNNEIKGSHQNFISVCKKYFHKEDLLLVPNVLCYLRVLFSIAFVIIYVIPFSVAGNEMGHIYIAAGVVALSAYTDFLDGFIARKFDMMSGTGQIIDPIADKLSQFSIVLALSISYHDFISLFVLLGVYVVKEVWMFFAAIFLARKNRSFHGAKWFGKVATFITYVVLGSLLLAGPFILQAYPVESDAFHAHLIFDSMITLALFFNLLAFLLYFIQYKKMMHGAGIAEVEENENKKEENENAENL